MNEAVYRSPSWLKKYLDFEINTGEDISGKSSEREIRKKWEKRWREIDEDELKDFYKDVFSKHIYRSDLSEIKSEWIGNFEFWSKYDAWLKEKRDKEAKQAEIKRDLDNLYQRLIEDFSNNPWEDKYRATGNGGEVTFYYTFEDGDKFEMTDNRISYDGHTYTVGLIYRNKFVSLANEMISKGMKRPSGRRSYNSSGSGSSGSRKSTKSKYSDHPKGNLYQTLKDTVAQRKEQLAKMSKNDENRSHMENELKAAEKKLKEMKDKYQFENLVSFWDFK
jgi:hypothetical protein